MSVIGFVGFNHVCSMFVLNGFGICPGVVRRSCFLSVVFNVVSVFLVSARVPVIAFVYCFLMFLGVCPGVLHSVCMFLKCFGGLPRCLS